MERGKRLGKVMHKKKRGLKWSWRWCKKRRRRTNNRERKVPKLDKRAPRGEWGPGPAGVLKGPRSDTRGGRVGLRWRGCGVGGLLFGWGRFWSPDGLCYGGSLGDGEGLSPNREVGEDLQEATDRKYGSLKLVRFK